MLAYLKTYSYICINKNKKAMKKLDYFMLLLSVISMFGLLISYALYSEMYFYVFSFLLMMSVVYNIKNM